MTSSAQSPSGPADENELPVFASGNVPVFTCHVILSGPDADGRITGRVANLSQVSASAASERDVLTAITRRFRDIVRQHVEAGTAIPFLDPPDQRAEGERERFVPVHL